MCVWGGEELGAPKPHCSNRESLQAGQRYSPWRMGSNDPKTSKLVPREVVLARCPVLPASWNKRWGVPHLNTSRLMVPEAHPVPEEKVQKCKSTPMGCLEWERTHPHCALRRPVTGSSCSSCCLCECRAQNWSSVNKWGRD